MNCSARHLSPVDLCRAVLALVMLLASGAKAEDVPRDALWAAAKSGDLIVLMRHALAPGTGDPDEFELGDCTTQRNLSAEGLEQARRIGDLFRTQGISRARVFTSQWCRCRDTAEALALGPVTELPVLNSFFRDFSTEERQTRELTHWLSSQPRSGPLILVTHQVNITALTGVFPASGELVFVRVVDPGTVSVEARLETR